VKLDPPAVARDLSTLLEALERSRHRLSRDAELRREVVVGARELPELLAAFPEQVLETLFERPCSSIF
jgi:hypothetical protein